MFTFIKETGIKNPAVSEKDQTIIYFQSRRLPYWTEHFSEQFSWFSITHQLPNISKQPECQLDATHPALIEFEKAINNLKKRRAGEPDELATNFLKW